MNNRLYVPHLHAEATETKRGEQCLNMADAELLVRGHVADYPSVEQTQLKFYNTFADVGGRNMETDKRDVARVSA